MVFQILEMSPCPVADVLLLESRCRRCNNILLSSSGFAGISSSEIAPAVSIRRPREKIRLYILILVSKWGFSKNGHSLMLPTKHRFVGNVTVFSARMALLMLCVVVVELVRMYSESIILFIELVSSAFSF